VTFTAAANSYPGAALSYAWTFGDGSAATGASVPHAYSAAGPYTAMVTVSDGVGGTTSGTAQVIVKVPLLGTGNDSDGDGFSDAFESTAGTNPQDAASTPFGGLSAGAAAELTLTKASIKLNFAKPNADSIKFSGSVVVPANFTILGAKVYAAIGNVVKAFTLDAKGSSKVGGDALKISIKAQKGVVSAQTAKFSASLSKGNFAAQLADAGLTGDADVKAVPRTVPFTLEFNGATLQKVQTMSYTAKKGKAGMAK
jgi:PKD repeat protein